MSLLCRCHKKFIGSLCSLPQPIHGSMPIRTTFPSLILHVIPSWMRGIELITAFQMTDMLLFTLCYCLNQSIKSTGQMYFACATQVQRLFGAMSCQSSFTGSAFENKSSLLIPQPPHFLGLAIVSHLTHANNLPGWLAFQRNLQHEF